jgi:hypothetical protein
MAHLNVDERRAYVQKLLDEGVKFDYRTMVEVGKMFCCSHSAIRADVYLLTRDGALPTPHVSARLWERIRERDNFTCQYCGTQERDNEFIIEHVIPASAGGVARPYNLVIACQSCNSTKRSKVWIPRNLGEITKNEPSWKVRVLELADPNQPNLFTQMKNRSNE